MKIAATISNTY